MSITNYCNDARVKARDGRWYESISADQRTAKTIPLPINDGWDDEQFDVPIRWVACPTCDGRGSHANPSVDCDGLPAEDFAQDPDLAEDYMSGRFDVACYGCGGQRVVPECMDEQVAEKIADHFDALAEMHAERMAEIRMGA